MSFIEIKSVPLLECIANGSNYVNVKLGKRSLGTRQTPENKQTNHNRLSNMRRDKYGECRRGIFNNKDGCLLRYRGGIKRAGRNYRQKICVFVRRSELLVMICCRPVQLRPEAFWSAPLGNLTSGEHPD